MTDVAFDYSWETTPSWMIQLWAPLSSWPLRSCRHAHMMESSGDCIDLFIRFEFNCLARLFKDTTIWNTRLWKRFLYDIKKSCSALDNVTKRVLHLSRSLLNRESMSITIIQRPSIPEKYSKSAPSRWILWPQNHIYLHSPQCKPFGWRTAPSSRIA